jgi:hypothetical protein
MTRLARGPDGIFRLDQNVTPDIDSLFVDFSVIWDRKRNPTPWNNVEQGTNVKLMNISGKFDKRYVCVDDI